MPRKLPNSDRPPADGAEIREFPARERRSKLTEMIEKPGPPVDREVRERNITLIMIGGFLVLLIVAGVWIMGALRDLGKMQDCAMQGRRNCAPIEVPSRDR